MKRLPAFLAACLVAVVAFPLATAAAPSARADDYPTRPVTLIVPYTPGGSTEILARITAQKLEERLGKPVIVENKPGAGTVIGSTAVAQSTPDGYTLLMATPTPMAINVTVHKSCHTIRRPTSCRWEWSPARRSSSSSIRSCR